MKLVYLACVSLRNVCVSGSSLWAAHFSCGYHARKSGTVKTLVTDDCLM